MSQNYNFMKSPAGCLTAIIFLIIYYLCIYLYDFDIVYPAYLGITLVSSLFIGILVYIFSLLFGFDKLSDDKQTKIGIHIYFIIALIFSLKYYSETKIPTIIIGVILIMCLSFLINSEIILYIKNKKEEKIRLKDEEKLLEKRNNYTVIKKQNKDGILISEKNYLVNNSGNKTLHGWSRKYFENGIINIESDYAHGKKNGYERFYNKYGNMIKESIYSAGKLHGSYFEYYVSSNLPKIKIEGKYLNNHKDGYWFKYYKSGEYISIENYNKGKRIGWEFQFRDNQRLFFQNDKGRNLKILDYHKELQINDSFKKFYDKHQSLMKLEIIIYKPVILKPIERITPKIETNNLKIENYRKLWIHNKKNEIQKFNTIYELLRRSELNQVNYGNLLNCIEWKFKRFKILVRDKFTCEDCGNLNNSLHVHHKYYLRNALPWEIEDEALVSLCINCHVYRHENEQISLYRKIANKLVLENHNYEICSRCNGSRYLPQFSHVENGICFKCREDTVVKSIFNNRLREIINSHALENDMRSEFSNYIDSNISYFYYSNYIYNKLA
jgi:antitoxin component YwqK of YwqJK toxin-antitoxin module